MIKMNISSSEFKKIIEDKLKSYLPSSLCMQSKLIEAMEYSLLNGGKRIRAMITAQFCFLCGGTLNMVLPFACAVEMIHAYSLIHDDLPIMDNDDLRRGKPSCHIVFGEDIALLAGDALQTLAFETMLRHYDRHKVGTERALSAALELAAAAGPQGMAGGQAIDLMSQNKTISAETLSVMHKAKTGALFVACGKIGCIIAGADSRKILAAQNYCEKIGLAFQIVDDILDFIGDTETMGKKAGSDSSGSKSTYVTVFGLEKSLEIARKLTEEAKKSLSEFDEKSDFLYNLADELLIRKN